MAKSISLKLNFSGGMENLFGGTKSTQVTFPVEAAGKGRIAELLVWIRDNLLKERAELFLDGESVRPGILVLINDADWELEGELEYELQDRDEIVFISTLHGG
ncbi:ubiquitin-related modifier 1 [Blastocladiella britannica]|nr:ubiquitin-related modifier 1 [Blastocladiella britannica]